MAPEVWNSTDRISYHFGPSYHFLPFYPPNNLKSQNFQKLDKKPGDIILNMCTINDNHMMYSSWDMKCARQNFLSFWTVFCLFTPPTQKIKILKNWMIILIILHMCTTNDNHMMYSSWDMKRDRQNFLSFWTFFFSFLLP